MRDGLRQHGGDLLRDLVDRPVRCAASGTVGSHWRSSVPHLLQTKKVKYSLITTLVNIPELIRRGVFCGIKLDGILADELGTSC